MLQIKCYVNINRVISVVCCIRDRLPCTDGVCTDFQASQLLKLTIETKQCRLLDMRIWWYLTSFAVCGRTVAMVCQIWHEPSVNLSQHYKIGSPFFGELHRLGYRWHYCVSSLSLMVLHARYLTFSVHPHLPIQETKWQLTWLWHLWYLMWWYI